MLIVIPFNSEQAEQAEALLDWIYALSGKAQSGSCLLIAASDLHPEYQLKVRLAAEVAFSNVELAIANKDNLFETAVAKVREIYKTPWLCLEPDCVPLKPDWQKQLSDFYDAQPKRCAGSHLIDKESGKQWLARQSIYPPDNFPADTFLASTKYRLIQQGTFGKDLIRADAVLFCSDKSGELIKSLREELNGNRA